VSEPPVHLVLDASAVRAYPNIHVGETLTQVAENGGSFVTPLPCLVEARDGDLAAMTDVLGRF
jgi:hypothetical protein